jgi:CheY-like chemotaxis protein
MSARRGLAMPASQVINNAGALGLLGGGGWLLGQATSPSAEAAGYGIGVAGAIGVIMANLMPTVKTAVERHYDNKREERAARVADLQRQIEEAREDAVRDIEDARREADRKAEALAREKARLEVRVRELEQKSRAIGPAAAHIAGLEVKAAAMEGQREATIRALKELEYFKQDRPGTSDDIPTGLEASRLLIVEDDPAVVRGLARLFGHEGFAVTAAASAPEALAAVEASLAADAPPGDECFGWALVDLNLEPGGVGTGIEVLESLQARCPRTRLAVVTGEPRDSPLYHRALSALGPEAIVFRKPIDWDAMRATIRPRRGAGG